MNVISKIRPGIYALILALPLVTLPELFNAFIWLTAGVPLIYLLVVTDGNVPPNFIMGSLGFTLLHFCLINIPALLMLRRDVARCRISDDSNLIRETMIRIALPSTILFIALMFALKLSMFALNSSMFAFVGCTISTALGCYIGLRIIQKKQQKMRWLWALGLFISLIFYVLLILMVGHELIQVLDDILMLDF